MSKSHLTDGQPDLTQEVVRRRVQAALGCALACFSASPHSWSSKFINRHIGRTNDRLGNWLRSKLITCTDDFFSFEVGNSKAGQVKQLLGYMDKNPVQSNEQLSPTPSIPLPAIGQVEQKCVKKDTVTAGGCAG